MGLSRLDHRGGSSRLRQAREAAWRRWPSLDLCRWSGVDWEVSGPGQGGEEAIIIMTIIVTVSLNPMSGKMLIRLFA